MAKLFLPLEVDFDDDPDVAKLARYPKPCEARAARDLLVAMWRYCKRERTDGHVPDEIVGRLAYPDSPKIGHRDATRIVEVGLAERTETGYYLPGYLKRNKSRAQLEAEAKVKAEAGRKGGQASSVLRKIEADGKQSATPGASDLRSHRQRTEVETETPVQDRGGERYEPLRPVAATSPPVKPTSSCTRHPNGNPTDEPCGGCRADKERREKQGDRAAEQDRREAEARARACTRCDGVRVVGDNGAPTRRLCVHRRTA